MDKYWYCAVKMEEIDNLFMYISDMGRIPLGTIVEVPFGEEDIAVRGEVQSCIAYKKDEVPFLLETTKHILSICAEDLSEKVILSEEDVKKILHQAEELIKIKDYNNLLKWAFRHQDIDNDIILNKVIESYHLCIEHGMPIAALDLGTLYYTGRGVEQDYQKAYMYYKIAADAGDVRAICNCGYIFYYGRLGQKDFQKAYEFYSLGALIYSDANCMYKLGDMFSKGECVSQNDLYAFSLYRSAYSNMERNTECRGDILMRLGTCYLKGMGTQRDIQTAHGLLCSALNAFYNKKGDVFVHGLIEQTKELILQAENILDKSV